LEEWDARLATADYLMMQLQEFFKGNSTTAGCGNTVNVADNWRKKLLWNVLMCGMSHYRKFTTVGQVR